MQRSALLLGFLGIVAAVLIAAGLAAGGYLAGRGVAASRLDDRFVTVKGVAEIEAAADLATYPLRVTMTGGDLIGTKARIDDALQQITAYLRDYGFGEDELAAQRLEVQDFFSMGYRPEGLTEDSRYMLAQAVLIRSSNIDLVTKVSQDVGELVRRGIVINDAGGPTYIVTAGRLKELKPHLIRRATLAAKDAAAEFAATSGSKVGDIRRANQGVIVVRARDESPMIQEFQSAEKRIRAVVTIEYLLAR
ncbi:SIMPL domain-containing protein [Rhodospirillaceae bacterium SYSU D60014]|uniref:SIMPL domain-containing protein n=1 Tax=Virgifigura deserti TaxID=2268457 RepID=UPI000E663E84